MKALSCGLIVDERGCTCGNSAVFTDLFAENGIQFTAYDKPVLASAETPLWGARQREVKMKKWSCGCTTVRCAVKLSDTCHRCGSDFKFK